jgi:hypothetical protein
MLPYFIWAIGLKEIAFSSDSKKTTLHRSKMSRNVKKR